MEDLKGKLIYTDQGPLDRLFVTWRKKIIPAIEDVQMEYNKLDIGKFGTDSFESLMTQGIAFVQGKLLSKVRSELASYSKATSSLIFDEEKIHELTESLSGKLDILNKVIAFNSNSMSPVDVKISDCTIDKGKVVVDYEAITIRHQARLDTDEKVQLYNVMKGLREGHELLKELIKSISGHEFQLTIGEEYTPSQKLLFEDENGELVWDELLLYNILK
jgi:hypothetical protein